MKPITQAIVDPAMGDCTRACLASILELEIDAVPNFSRFGQNYFKILHNFIWALGYDFFGTGFPIGPDRPKGDTLKESVNVNGFVIASVPSRTYPELGHSVVMNLEGVIIHDPNPNRLWQNVNALETKQLQHWMLIGPKEAEKAPPPDLKTFIDVGGSLDFPYKKDLMEWCSDVKLYKFHNDYFVSGAGFREAFADFDSAHAFFKENLLSGKNLAMLMNRLQNKGLVSEGDLWALECNSKTVRDQEIIDKINGLLEKERFEMERKS